MKVKAMPQDWVNTDPKVAQISMAIPLAMLKESATRADVTSTANDTIDAAKAHTNYMQIFVYKRPKNNQLPETVYVLQYPAEEGGVLVAGPYVFEDITLVQFGISEAGEHFDIVAVAGHSSFTQNGSGSKPLLFAAGALQNQTITLNENNGFSVNLYSVNYTLTAPSEVHVRTADEIRENVFPERFAVSAKAVFNYKSPLAVNLVPGYGTLNHTGPNDTFHFIPGYNHMQILLMDETYPYQKMEVEGTNTFPSTSTWEAKQSKGDTYLGTWSKIPVADIDWDTIADVEVDEDGNRFVWGGLYHRAWRFHITNDPVFSLIQDAWSVAEYDNTFFPVSPYMVPIKFTEKSVTPTTVTIVVGWGAF